MALRWRTRKPREATKPLAPPAPPKRKGLAPSKVQKGRSEERKQRCSLFGGAGGAGGASLASGLPGPGYGGCPGYPGRVGRATSCAGEHRLGSPLRVPHYRRRGPPGCLLARPSRRKSRPGVGARWKASGGPSACHTLGEPREPRVFAGWITAQRGASPDSTRDVRPARVPASKTRNSPARRVHLRK